MDDTAALSQFVAASREAMRKMAGELVASRRDRVAALQEVPRVVDALRAAGVVPDEDVKVANASLATHAGALSALAEMGRRAAATARDVPARSSGLGEPVARRKAASAHGADEETDVPESLRYFREQMAELRASR